MKVGCKIIAILLSALVVMTSADVSFALPKKLPKFNRGKLPRVTLPKQTLGTRNMGKALAPSPNVAGKAAEQIISSQVTRAAAQAAKKAEQFAPSSTSVVPQTSLSTQVSATPQQSQTPPVTDTGTNLTGMQVLAKYFPTWQQELGGMFSKEQLDAVEKAFAATDDWIFVQGEDGELSIRNKDEWNYESRFLTILTRDSGVKFTDKQIKQLIGGRGSNGFIFTFRLYFLRMNATGFSCAKEGKKPRAQISRDGKSLSLKEMTLEEEQERRIGLGLTRSRNHPLVEAYMQQKNHPKSESKTPEEYVMLAKQYPSRPRAHIYRNGRALSREEMTPEEVQEVNIGMGLYGHPNHPLVRAYLQENRRIAEAKTAEEYLELARQYPTKPRTRIYRNGRILSEEEMTEEEIEETIIGKGLYNHSNHPLVQAYLQENRQLAESKTAEEYVKLARQYPSKPRAEIWKNRHKLSREEMTPEEVQEVNIGNGLNYHRNHPLVRAYMQENRLYAESKTPEEYVMLARQYPSKPRAHIYRNGRALSREEMTPEEVQEVNIGMGLSRYPNHPLVRAYMQENRIKAVSQTTQQLYVTLVDYIKNHSHYPIVRGNSLYTNIYNRLYYYRSTMTTDGKYADPWLQKIYELKTAVQNAPEGKFTLTPDGQGGYILEIEEPSLEELTVTAQPVEEITPATPSPHTIRLRITEQTKSLIESVRDAAALERHEFPVWLRSMHQPENFAQLVDKNTVDALHVLNRAINFDYRNGQNRRAVTYLLQTVNNYVGLLGEQSGVFYKLIYRGSVDETLLPVADNFHVVAEEQGMSWDGELAPQVEKVNRLHITATKEGSPYSVYLEGDDEMVTTLGIEPKVPVQTVKYDLEVTLKHLLPPGYTVRMGMHEIGIVGKDFTRFRNGRVHLHLENATPQPFDEGLQIDHSISLDVDVRRFAKKWNATTRRFDESRLDQEIAQNYLTLFDSFLDQETKDFLRILAGVSK